MEFLKLIFDPNFKITFSTIIVSLPSLIFLILIISIIKRKKNLVLVKAELSITNPKLYYELNRDKEKDELILENGVLKEEINALNKKNTRLSIFALIVLFLTALSSAFFRKDNES